MAAGLLTAIVTRREPRRGPDRTAAARNVRPIVDTGRDHDAPEPIRQGDTPARPARQQIATFQAIAPYKAVMRDDFLVATLAPINLVQTPSGAQLAWMERANIHKPLSDAWGSLVGEMAPLYPEGA